MLVDAEPHTTTGAQRCTLALKPCRFCGETENLRVDRGAWEALWSIDEDGEVRRGPTGEPTDIRIEAEAHLHHVDLISCGTCDSDAPLHVWNSTPDFMAKVRANMLAADAEYDDDGIWQGRVQ